jgi:hypothetical protein
MTRSPPLMLSAYTPGPQDYSIPSLSVSCWNCSLFYLRGPQCCRNICTCTQVCEYVLERERTCMSMMIPGPGPEPIYSSHIGSILFRLCSPEQSHLSEPELNTQTPPQLPIGEMMMCDLSPNQKVDGLILGNIENFPQHSRTHPRAHLGVQN